MIVDGRSLGPGLEASVDVPPGIERPAKSIEAQPKWTSWPPAGPVPLDVFSTERLDEIGWTFDSTTDLLDRVTVTVSVAMKNDPRSAVLPVTVHRLEPLLGSRSAVRFVPNGWKTEADRVYSVKVEALTQDASASGDAPPAIDFDVEPVSCP